MDNITYSKSSHVWLWRIPLVSGNHTNLSSSSSSSRSTSTSTSSSSIPKTSRWPTTSTSTSPSMFLDCNKYGLNSSYILVSFRAYQSIVNGEAEGCSSWHDIFSRKTHPETQRAAARKSGSWPTARLGESTSVVFPIDQITGFKVVKYTLWLFNIAMV